MQPLKTMYPGVPYSPYTELSQPVNATSSIMELVDASVLPPPPNWAIIGSPSGAETIYYTVKVGNELQGVQRGMQEGGVGRVWSAGTEIARYFTEEDYRRLIANIKTIDANIGTVKDETADEFVAVKKTISDGLTDLESKKMPVAPPIYPHLAIGNQWIKAEGTELRSVVLVSEGIDITKTDDILEISEEDWQRMDKFTIVFNGAFVLFEKESSTNVLYAIGADSNYYKFEIDRNSRLIYITRSELISPPSFGVNILHNWDFRNPVNQRGLSTYRRVSNYTYTIDRWIVATGAASWELTLENGYIRITRISATGSPAFHQRIEHPHTYIGKTLTLSVICRGVITGDAIMQVIGLTPTNVIHNVPINITPEFSLIVTTFTVPETFASGILGVYPISMIDSESTIGDYIDIQAVKLEFGTVSTLANDPPVDFGKELAICQRYFLRLENNLRSRITSYTGSTIDAFISTPVTMRTNPSLTGRRDIYTLTGADPEVGFSIVSQFHTSSGVVLRGTKTNHGLTDGYFRAGFAGTTEAAFLSADL